MKPFDDFLKTLKSLHEEYKRNTSNGKFNELNISEEDFEKIFPSLDYSNLEDITSNLLRFFRSKSHVNRLTDAIIKASGLEVTEEAQIKSITTVSEAINTYFEIGTESGELESDLWIETIERIYRRQTPKHENPNLEREFLEGMKNGDCLQASWTYRDGDAEGNENKYSDFHLVKRNGNYFLFCAKKDGNLVSSKLDNDQDILHQIHSIITTLDAFDENPQLKTVENIKQGRFIRTAEIKSPVIRHAPFKEKILDDLLLKLNANANLEDEDKSLLLMISSFFIASQGVSENFQRPLNLDETKNLIRFLNNGLDAVEDPLFAARITLCDQDRLSSMSDLSRVFQEFFQGSQHAPFTKNKAVTIAAGREPSAGEKDDILSGKKYCFCASPGGAHYFGLVFGKEIDGSRNIYVQDSTETTNESILSSYQRTIDNIWPAKTRGRAGYNLIKTVKKRDREEAMFDSPGTMGIQNQCRYSAIVFSEQVINELKKGSIPREGSIEYGEEDFTNRFARWFDESSLVMKAAQKGEGLQNFNPDDTYESRARDLEKVNVVHSGFIKADGRSKISNPNRPEAFASEPEEKEQRVLPPLPPHHVLKAAGGGADSFDPNPPEAFGLNHILKKSQPLERATLPPLPPHHVPKYDCGGKEQRPESTILPAQNEKGRSLEFNPEIIFEKIKHNLKYPSDKSTTPNPEIMSSLTPEQRNLVYAFSLATYERNSFSDRISKLINECEKQKIQTQLLQPSEEVMEFNPRPQSIISRSQFNPKKTYELTAQKPESKNYPASDFTYDAMFSSTDDYSIEGANPNGGFIKAAGGGKEQRPESTILPAQNEKGLQNFDPDTTYKEIAEKLEAGKYSEEIKKICKDILKALTQDQKSQVFFSSKTSELNSKYDLPEQIKHHRNSNIISGMIGLHAPDEKKEDYPHFRFKAAGGGRGRKDVSSASNTSLNEKGSQDVNQDKEIHELINEILEAGEGSSETSSLITDLLNSKASETSEIVGQQKEVDVANLEVAASGGGRRNPSSNPNITNQPEVGVPLVVGKGGCCNIS